MRLLWQNGLRNELLRSAEQVVLGPQYLFEQELRDVPVGQWPARIDNLKPKFGYGLGLAIVRRICDWNRAEVSVAESTLGGALFRFRWLSGEHEAGMYITAE